ncbi:MAG TPA: hypothetical protein DCP28_01475, partial [Cytophagales bacterium]|nr:hypothetical protein [Cytophagales bacterium]
TVTDLQGRRVRQQAAVTGALTLHELPQGIYLVTLANNEAREVVQVVVR